MRTTPFRSAEVKAKFDAYPADVRAELLALRELVFSVAAATPQAGDLEETLKWGEPAYVTKNGAGSTVRIDWKPKSPTEYAMYFNCRTTLVETFRSLFPDDFRFSGNRALVFTIGSRPAQDALRFCIATSLTYHVRERPGRIKPAARG